MDLKKHVIDTIKEWQIKIGYREGNMKLYYPGESLLSLLAVEREVLEAALSEFCKDCETTLGRIKVSGSFERYCLDIPAKGCAYVAGKVEEPEFLKALLEIIAKSGNSMEQVRQCFADYARKNGTASVEERIEDGHSSNHTKIHSHDGLAFYFEEAFVDEYVYWVEENEFGLTYHRFTRDEYKRIK